MTINSLADVKSMFINFSLFSFQYFTSPRLNYYRSHKRVIPCSLRVQRLLDLVCALILGPFIVRFRQKFVVFPKMRVLQKIERNDYELTKIECSFVRYHQTCFAHKYHNKLETNNAPWVCVKVILNSSNRLIIWCSRKSRLLISLK
jgi:hypothetical protein